MERMEFLGYELWGNTVQDYLVSCAIFVVTVLTLVLANRIVIRRLKAFSEKTENQVDDFVIGLMRQMLFPVFYIGALVLAFRHLDLAPAFDNFLFTAFRIILIVQGVRLGLAVFLYILRKAWLKSDPAAGSAAFTVMRIIRVVIWGLAIVFLFDNLGYDVNSVIAGLGITGLAVAMAAQTILGDLFNSFVIFFDKPFKHGDFVIVGDLMGVIEHVGIKTTRIRSLWGEQLVFSNSDLTASRIRNYKRMEERRVMFKLGVVYQTPLETMKKIPEIIRAAIQSVKETRFDRAHFGSYGDFNLEIEIVYYVLSPDYNKYMDIQQEINFKIMEVFRKEKIEFAYPTQTLFVSKN